MRKFLIVVCCILAFICLFTAAFQWYFTPARYSGETPRREIRRYLENSDEVGREIVEKSVQALSADNAAKYYLMACLELKTHSPHPEAWEKIEGIVEDGWQGEEAELKKLLSEDEPALDLMRIAAEKKFCSFPQSEAIDPVSVCLTDFRTISELLMTKALLLEHEGESDQARETIVQSFRFTADLSDSAPIVNAALGIGIGAIVRPVAYAYIMELDDEEVCAKFLADLVTIEESRASVHDMLERERDTALAHLLDDDFSNEMLYCGIPSKADVDSSEKKQIGEYFVDTAVRAGGYLFSRLFRPILKWGLKKGFREVLAEAEKPYPEYYRNRPEEKTARRNPVRMLCEAVTSFIPILNQDKADRQATVIRTALRLHFLRNGEYPETLDELLALVPEHILIDPFSTKRFIYKKTDDGYLFYSVGPNVIDNGGEQAEYPYLEGDLVFRLPEVDEKC